jgi:NAD(P)-dependent dehydrogenase (short-subunit alcohol dehydrogenase family)
MSPYPFVLISPGTRGLSLALVRHYLQTTPLPVYTTYRSGTDSSVTHDILSSLKDADQARLRVFKLDLTKEDTIAGASDALARALPKDKDTYLHTAFITGGVLHPERQPANLDLTKIEETFRINTISHLLMVKHFSRFLPSASSVPVSHLSKWVHVSARVGSVSDNKLGGWFSYRASKAAVNQIVRTFDLDLQNRRVRAMCIGVHPGTVKTELSREFWEGVEKKGRLFEPDYAAERMVDVVEKLTTKGRGRIWDWKGEEVKP